MRLGTASRYRQRAVARVYHLLAKEAAFTPNLQYLDDFRAAQRLERQVETPGCSCSLRTELASISCCSQRPALSVHR